jgi:hypothetical protein
MLLDKPYRILVEEWDLAQRRSFCRVYYKKYEGPWEAGAEVKKLALKYGDCSFQIIKLISEPIPGKEIV